MPKTNLSKYKKNKDLNGTKVQYTVIILLTVISLFFFLQSPFFEIGKIYVVGTEKITINQVLDLAGTQPGLNILRIKATEIEKKLATHPWIKDAQVEKKLPSTVIINIVERKATAIIPVEEGYLIIDETGVVLMKLDNLAEIVLPVITNVPLAENLLNGEQIKNEKVINALEIIEKLPETIRLRVSEVFLGEGIMIYIIGGLEIKIGTTEKITEKLQLVTDIFSNTDDEVLAQMTYIDLRFNGPPIIKYGK